MTEARTSDAYKYGSLNIKGDQPLFFKKGETKTMMYVIHVDRHRNSSDMHYHLKYPGIISKRAYRELGPENRRNCLTFNALFSRYMDRVVILNALMKLSELAGLDRSDEGFWAYPTDYGIQPCRLVPEAEFSQTFFHPKENTSIKSCIGDHISTALSANDSYQKSDRSLTLNAFSQHSNDWPSIIMDHLGKKDAIIMGLSEQLGVVIAEKKAAQDTVQDLGKRLEAMRAEHESERRAWETKILRYEVTAQIKGWKLPSSESNDEEEEIKGIEGEYPVKKLRGRKKKGGNKGRE
jgi:hypothetical protein